MKKSICFSGLLLLLQALSLSFVSAQSGRYPWMDGEFPPAGSSFEYRVERGEGKSLRAAREDAFNSLLIDLGNQAGVRVTSRTLSEIKRELQSRPDSQDYNETERSTTTYRIDREGFRAFFVKVGEYHERVRTAAGEVYRLWALYEVSDRRSFRPYFPEYTDRYGGDAFWRSMLLPGWGQLYKGSKAKGLCIIGGETAFVGGLVAAENLRASYMQKISATHHADHIRTYARKADTMKNIRNLCIAGAAALYIYNIIDAVAAPGNKHLITRERSLALYPVANEQYTGIGFVINF
ncbi:MAG: DUF5683 domain-containing protein [Tannerellaceae bacterium]|jgi:hypothetical protein|nr:DUF5683 domain-containing protein [Tannerellaceae bacterium]